ncbi:hypothetical protein B0I35DRAFT_426671 [Stachybotrys elegans]|uniref:Uncharacterized protein n=1 Tax=Stachybotrys elegans TaxID=80388 RepID=A0A8K0SUP3_9HYPO|nr:hypothetical protein B0I35DRAFT_426671 [Stachybotrys elegans]
MNPDLAPRWTRAYLVSQEAFTAIEANLANQGTSLTPDKLCDLYGILIAPLWEELAGDKYLEETSCEASRGVPSIQEVAQVDVFADQSEPPVQQTRPTLSGLRKNFSQPSQRIIRATLRMEAQQRRTTRITAPQTISLLWIMKFRQESCCGGLPETQYRASPEGNEQGKRRGWECRRSSIIMAETLDIVGIPDLVPQCDKDW